MKNINKIRHIPGFIVQGALDLQCPMDGAWALHKHWPAAELIKIEGAGHSTHDIAIQQALIATTDKIAGLQRSAT